MGRFEDSLWTELQREHGQALLQNMAKQRSKRTARWIGAAAAVAVLGTGALAASTYFGGAPPAYAVVDNPDGTVTLKIRDLTKFEEATAKLREHGVPAVALGQREDCRDVGRLLDPMPYTPFELVDDRMVGDERLLTVTRDRIPAGATLVLALVDMKVPTTNGTPAQAMFVTLYERDHTPSCLRPAPEPQRGSLPPTGR